MFRVRARARAFTLVELLIAVALVGAVAAAVLPSVASRLTGARAESAARRVETLLMEAGAVAAAEGVVVRVTATPRAGGVVIESVRERAREPDEAVVSAAELDGRPAAGLIIETLVFEDGERVGEAPPEVDEFGAVRSEAGPRFPADGTFGEPEAVRLATFLPDGTGLGQTFYLSLSGSVTFEFVMERWTGRARVERWAPERAFGAEAEGFDEEGEEFLEREGRVMRPRGGP